MTSDPSYIVVGAGAFGTSTALHLKAKYPAASVTLIDRDDIYNEDISPSRVAASWDWNKVVRADYRDPVYCALGLAARDAWLGNELWAPFYRESGIFWISRTDFALEVVDNFASCARDRGADALDVLPAGQARDLYGGVFADADYSGVEKVLVNRMSGWADAKGALRRAARTAAERGVRIVRAEVRELVFDEEEEGKGVRCVGVRSADGEVRKATHVILSTGAFTPLLLERAAESTERDALRAGGRMVAAGVTTGLVQIDEDTAAELVQMPVCIQENPPERGASNGALPPTEDKLLKWWGQCIFKNTQTLPSGRQISIPPISADYEQWSVPDALVEDVEFAKKATFGRFGEAWKTTRHRICWDAVTPSQDFIISPHSACEGLYIATCGSFHGWKFLPIIGDHVVRMLDGTLPPDLREKWAWDRELPDVAKNKVWPTRELRDFQ
ncbi:hypothetical protein AAE478_008344 [Parahypoxylon ruwenzoriense]